MIDCHQEFNDSYVRISRDFERFFKVFYEEFIPKSESIVLAFKGVDMDRQLMMLESSFIVLTAFSSTGRADDQLVQLAAHHHNMPQITENMYDLWADALIDAVKDVDPLCTPTVELAWRVVIAPGIAFMKHFNLES